LAAIDPISTSLLDHTKVTYGHSIVISTAESCPHVGHVSANAMFWWNYSNVSVNGWHYISVKNINIANTLKSAKRFQNVSNVLCVNVLYKHYVINNTKYTKCNRCWFKCFLL